MNRWRLLICALSVSLCAAACRLDPECFRADECGDGAVCVDRVCVPGAVDAGEDGGERQDGGDPVDAGPDAAADAGPRDGGDEDASDGGDPDGGDLDAGDEDAACIERTDGGPLDDEQSPFDELMLLHFDETGGATPEAANTAGGFGAATCTSGASCPQTGVCGVFGTAYRFRGAPLIATDPVFFREAVSQYGFEAWVRRTSTSTGCIFQTMQSNDTQGELTLCIDSQGRPFIDRPTRAIGDPIPLGVWTHIAVRRNDAQMIEILQDGVQTTIDELDSPERFISDRLVIGGDLLPGRNWNFEGDIDELRLTNRALDPAVDLSLNRPAAMMVWEVASRVWGANENGFGARQLVMDGRLPRIRPDLSEVLFIRCDPNCNTWVHHVETGTDRQLTFTNTQDFNVSAAYATSGATFYRVDRFGCESAIYNSSANNGGDGTFVTNMQGRIITSLDVGRTPTSDMLVFTTQSCTGPFESRVERIIEPLGAGTLETIYTSTTTDLVYANVRADPYGLSGAIVFDEQITFGGGQRINRVVQAITLPAPEAPVEVWLDGQTGAYSLRADWFVLSAPNTTPGQGRELVLYDWGAGGGHFRWLTTATPTITENIHPDVRAIFGN